MGILHRPVNSDQSFYHVSLIIVSFRLKQPRTAQFRRVSSLGKHALVLQYSLAPDAHRK